MSLAIQESAPTTSRWDCVMAHRSWLTGQVRRLIPSGADAEDVVQEALLRVASHPELRPEDAGALLCTTARNLCTDLYRATQPSPARHRFHNSLPRLSPSAEDVACRRVSYLELERILTRLPANWRRALRLRAAGYGISEIAAELGITYKSAESILARARRHMRSSMATEDAG